MKLGNLKLTLVGDGPFRLDGGAMFEVVPKPLWEKAKPPDERNRIPMAANCVLVERGADLVLVDAGIGDKYDERFFDRHGLDAGGPRLPDQIRAAGYELADVTHVLPSHLHYDHCGWCARRAASGAVVPTFPAARYFLERGEVEHARGPNDRDRASYMPENWEPLFEAGVVELYDDTIEPVAGVRAIKAPGHNADMCLVRFDGGAPEHQAVFWSDLVPTVAHVAYPWIMAFDLYPMTTLENKKTWLPQAVEGDWLCFFDHEHEHPVARLIEDPKGRLRAQPVEI